MTTLVIERVSKFFGHSRGILDINFVLPSGSVLAIHGENGAGKTTLLRCIAGHIPVTRGKILVEGLSLSSWVKRRSGAQVGFLGSDSMLYNHLTVRENLVLHSALRRLNLNSSTSREILESLDIPTFWDKLVAECSFGQTKRAALARTLLLAAPLIIFDEPTNGLDDSAQSAFISLIKQRAQNTSLLIFATHAKNLTQALATDILVLNSGRVRSFQPYHASKDSIPLPSFNEEQS